MNIRTYHRWIGLLITLPLLVIVLTGLVLQLRNKFEWIQPTSLSAELSSDGRYLTYEDILQRYPVQNVDQIILRPGKKNLSLRLKDGQEIQLHPQTGAVLKTAIRRTNFLIDLHQGSFFGAFGQYVLYLLTGLGLLFLILSGLLLFPFKRRTLYARLFSLRS